MISGEQRHEEIGTFKFLNKIHEIHIYLYIYISIYLYIYIYIYIYIDIYTYIYWLITISLASVFLSTKVLEHGNIEVNPGPRPKYT